MQTLASMKRSLVGSLIVIFSSVSMIAKDKHWEPAIVTKAWVEEGHVFASGIIGIAIAKKVKRKLTTYFYVLETPTLRYTASSNDNLNVTVNAGIRIRTEALKLWLLDDQEKERKLEIVQKEKK